MTAASETTSLKKPSDDGKVIGLASAAHFASHYFIMLLPPLFPAVRAEYGVTYTELGLAIASFNIVSALLQIPAGILTDHIGAAKILIAGLLCSALAFGLAATLPSFSLLIVMFGLAGVGNTVYHPAEYSILAHRVSASRIGSAFSIHTFSGMLGGALAPASVLLLEQRFGWRGAFLSATLLGVVVAAVLALEHSSLEHAERQKPANFPRAPVEPREVGWQLMTSWPLLRNLVLFILLGLVGGGLQNYSVVALVGLHGTPLSVADAALTGHLLLTALGVLLGGLVAVRSSRHDGIAAAGLIGVAAAVAPIAILADDPVLVVTLMAVAGLCSGLIMPSRDMIVRETAPPGSFGTVFGFVTTGFNIGGIISPLLFGWVMDHGHPGAVFALCVGFSLAAIVPALAAGRRRLEQREFA
jgi:MFS transporter, FSR family, fosmidomycin resistance protein